MLLSRSSWHTIMHNIRHTIMHTIGHPRHTIRHARHTIKHATKAVTDASNFIALAKRAPLLPRNERTYAYCRPAPPVFGLVFLRVGPCKTRAKFESGRWSAFLGNSFDLNRNWPIIWGVN